MLNQALILALLVLSIWYTMQEGELFGKLGSWLEDHLPYKIHPAVFECNVCMSPWYGSILYWVIPWEEIHIISASLKAWPIVVICAMGLNIVLNKLSKEEAKDED